MQRSVKIDKTDVTVRKIAKNSFFIFISRIVENGAGLVIVVLVANYLGVQNFGEFSFIRAVAFVLSPLVAFGSMRIIIREISVAKDHTAEILTAGFALNLLMTATVAVIVTGVLKAFDLQSSAGIASIYLAIFAQACLAMKSTINAGLFAHEIAKFAALSNILNRLLVIAAVILVIWLNQNLLMLFVVLACANLGGLLIAFFILKVTRIWTGRKVNLLANISFLLKESYPIAIVVFMVQGYTYVNTFFLRFFQDNWHVAMFESSQRIIIPLSMISTSVFLGFVPTLSRLGKHVESHERLLRVCETTLKFSLLIAFPICAFVAVASDQIILTIYNDDFAPAAKSLRILIWIIVPLFANGLLTFVLTSLYKQRLLLISNTLCFIVNAVLSWILVKDFGFTGVCFSVLIAYIVLFGVNFYFISVHLGRINLASITIIPGLMTLLFYYAAASLMVESLPRLLCMILYLLFYFVIIRVARIVTGNELRTIFRPAKKQPLVVNSGQ